MLPYLVRKLLAVVQLCPEQPDTSLVKVRILPSDLEPRGAHYPVREIEGDLRAALGPSRSEEFDLKITRRD